MDRSGGKSASRQIAANVVFFAKGVGPRTWSKKRQARNSMLASITFWLLALITLMVIVYLR